MLERLVCRGYRDFFDAVPALKESLERSEEVRLLGFTGSATIGSHDAIFHSVLDKPPRTHLHVLLISPLAFDELRERQKSTEHSPEDYQRRVFRTLEHLSFLRAKGRIDVRVRLYGRDPKWYFWVFRDSIVLDSHARGVGRRSPRLQLFETEGRGLHGLFAQLFENAWNEPGNREVDFGRFDEDLRQLREEARAGLEKSRSVVTETLSSSIAPSVWNIDCQTFKRSANVLPRQRCEVESASEFFYYGATGESQFGSESRDLADALRCGADGATRSRFLLLSPEAEEALREKVDCSLSGRSLERTRSGIHDTLRVLRSLKEKHRLDLEYRFRTRLGYTRLYLFDHSAFLSAFRNRDGIPAPKLSFTERGQDFLIKYLRERFLESWDRDVKSPAQRPVRAERAEPPPAARGEHPAVVFDVQKLELTIDREPRQLPQAVLWFLARVAEERGAFLPFDTDILGRPARRRRTELGTRLQRTALEIIRTTPGLGYKFQPWVKVIRGDGAWQHSRGDMDIFPSA